MPKQEDNSPSNEVECRKPRPYRMGKRQEATDETRARILEATRELILGEAALAGVTMDAVARQAGVARMTVYYQFKSKTGLLEALFDELAMRGGMNQLASAFQEREPRAALARYIEVFGGFWASDRLVMRRLRILGALDSELEQSTAERNSWRRAGTQRLVSRLSEVYGQPAPSAIEEAANVLFMLTSFESFDVLAGENRTPAEVAPLVNQLALAAFGIGEFVGEGTKHAEAAQGE